MRKILFLITSLLICISCTDLLKNKIVTQAIEYFPRGLNPAKHKSVAEYQIYSQIYETLLSLNSDYKTLQPKLALRWQISENNTNFIFYLRTNVYFHDGSILTADDVKESIEQQIINNPQSPIANPIKTVGVLNSSTLEIKLNSPDAAFLYALASPMILVIMSRQALQEHGELIKKNPSGTGPFRLTLWQDRDEIRLTAFDKYWAKDNEIKDIRFRYYENHIKKEESINKDDIDILYTVSGYAVDRLKWIGKIEYYVQPPVSLWYLGFNNSVKPFNDIRVRQAILKAINVPKLVFYVNRGNADVAKGPLPPTYLKYGKVKQMGYDPDSAKKLLRLAGYKKGLKLNCYFPKIAFSRQTLIQLIKSDLEKIGIELNIVNSESWDEHDLAILNGKAGLFVNGGKSAIIGDAENFLREFFYSESKFNFLRYQNESVDNWLDMARIEPDLVKRQELYAKIRDTIIKDIPAVFLYHVKPHFAFNREKIKALIVNPFGIVQYHMLQLN